MEITSTTNSKFRDSQYRNHLLLWLYYLHWRNQLPPFIQCLINYVQISWCLGREASHYHLGYISTLWSLLGRKRYGDNIQVLSVNQSGWLGSLYSKHLFKHLFKHCPYGCLGHPFLLLSFLFFVKPLISFSYQWHEFLYLSPRTK